MLHAAGPREDPAFALSQQDFDAAAAKATVGFSEGSSIAGRLDAFAPIGIPVQRGNCYVLVMTLQPGAAFNAEARQGLRLDILVAGDEVPTSNRHPVKGPGIVSGLGCPQASGVTKVALVAQVPSSPQAANRLGTGEFVLKVFTHGISAEALEGARVARIQSDAKVRAEREARQGGESGRPPPFRITVTSECRYPLQYYVHAAGRGSAPSPRRIPARGLIEEWVHAGDEISLGDEGSPRSSVTVSGGTRDLLIAPSCAKLHIR
jgi:hypothetical protein